MSETAPCTVCGEILEFYPKPGGPEGKQEAYCQKCHGIREKDEGRPATLEKKEFLKHTAAEKQRIADAKTVIEK